MERSSLFDSANFWLGLGGIAAGVSVAFLLQHIDSLVIAWPHATSFVLGLVLLVLALICVGRAIILYLAHRHFEHHMRDVVRCPDPEAHRLSHTEAIAAPTTKTLSILRQLRVELGDCQQKIQAAGETNKFWPVARNDRLRDEIWQENRPRLQETPGIGTVYTSLNRAYVEVKRLNQINSARFNSRVRLEDNLDTASGEIAQAIRELDVRIESLDQELLTEARHRLTQSSPHTSDASPASS